MSGQSLVFSESIDEVLKVVQETPRGRWFIEAYTQRVKSEGTNNILSAIAKLENHISNISKAGASDEVLQKARNAIAQARQEIANLEPKTVTLSSEAQLFANLAQMSRQAFGENQGGKSVERALKLVADLDRDLNATPPAPESTVATKPAQHYFKQDETIFEPAPAPKLVVQAPPIAKVADLPEVSSKGAKLVIRRLAPTEPVAPAVVEATVEESATVALAEPEIETPPDAQIEVAPVQEAPVVPAPASAEPIAQTPVENSRIVIIRRKANETMEVPLVDAEENAA